MVSAPVRALGSFLRECKDIQSDFLMVCFSAREGSGVFSTVRPPHPQRERRRRNVSAPVRALGSFLLLPLAQTPLLSVVIRPMNGTEWPKSGLFAPFHTKYPPCSV